MKKLTAVKRGRTANGGAKRGLKKFLKNCTGINKKKKTKFHEGGYLFKPLLREIIVGDDVFSTTRGPKIEINFTPIKFKRGNNLDFSFFFFFAPFYTRLAFLFKRNGHFKFK